MGHFWNNFKTKTGKATDAGQRALEQTGKKILSEKKEYNQTRFHERKHEELGYEEDNPILDEGYDDPRDNEYNNPNEYDIGIQPAQKSESFHHFILENQYKDLERSIRGFKDVYNKDTNKWEIKRKPNHCFTDEEAEDILRTAQSHLATDIKLGWIPKDVFGNYMDALYKEIAFLFESIAEYRYGRYGSYDKQYIMKVQNQKIFLELWTRVQANYSRSVGGTENKYTHDSVKGQESLQQTDRIEDQRNYYS